MSRKCRGISEILSVIILIMATVASMAIYTTLSRERILANTLSVGEALKVSEDRATQLIAKVWFAKDNTNNLNVIYLINYGSNDVKISNVLVGGKKADAFETYPLTSPITSCNDPGLGGILPAAKINATVKLCVDPAGNDPPGDMIIMVTESGRVYELIQD